DEPVAACRGRVNMPLRVGRCAVLIALVLAVCLVPALTFAQPGPAIVVQPLHLDHDGSGDVVVTLTGEQPVDAYQLLLRFDPAVVRVVAVEPAERWEAIDHGIAVDKAGEIRIAAA